MIVNDITTLNPIDVSFIFKPKTQEELINYFKHNYENNKIVKYSIAGGRFSMGGQTAVANTVNIDMTGLNKIIEINKDKKYLTVEAGAVWRDIQEKINSYNLSISIMQTYSNFTVGGSLSVNVHGRYIGLGPIILSVLDIKVLLLDGQIINCSEKYNSKIFFSLIGGYSSVGIILEAKLSLQENVKIKEISKTMLLSNYLDFFEKNIRNNENIVFHNADIYPDDYTDINAVSWIKTNDELTIKEKLIPQNQKYNFTKYFIWAFTETPFGKWRRKNIYDPLIYSKKRVYTRNYEASYDASQLEPYHRQESTYVLQEYFIPYKHINDFVPLMTNIYKDFDINILNISIRHAKKDIGSYLAWAKEEMFCFVVYYKEYKTDLEKEKIAICTRQLVDLVDKFNGAYYLPYQPHATYEQFKSIYPDCLDLFKNKQILDPHYQLQNSLWEKYYISYLKELEIKKTNIINFSSNNLYNRENEFKMILDEKLNDNIYLFLKNIFNIFPTFEFHNFIKQKVKQNLQLNTNELYKVLYNNLKDIKSFKNNFRALKSLKNQKNVIKEQICSLNIKNINTYLEIGSTGRYVQSVNYAIDNSELGCNLLDKNIFVMNDIEPKNNMIDNLDRGQLFNKHSFIKLNYDKIDDKFQNKFDLISCIIGLHHCPEDKLFDFIQSIYNSITNKGYFLLRDHDCHNNEMKIFASLIHSIFNLGTDVLPENNEKEIRNFQSIDFWIDLLEKVGFKKVSNIIYQNGDPSKNGLILFQKI